MTGREISTTLGIGENAVQRDLKHVAKTVRTKGKVLMAEPASCEECGFVFNPQRTSPPSSCPECRSNRISPPRFIIESR